MVLSRGLCLSFPPIPRHRFIDFKFPSVWPSMNLTHDVFELVSGQPETWHVRFNLQMVVNLSWFLALRLGIGFACGKKGSTCLTVVMIVIRGCCEKQTNAWRVINHPLANCINNHSNRNPLASEFVHLQTMLFHWRCNLCLVGFATTVALDDCPWYCLIAAKIVLQKCHVIQMVHSSVFSQAQLTFSCAVGKYTPTWTVILKHSSTNGCLMLFGHTYSLLSQNILCCIPL